MLKSRGIKAMHFAGTDKSDFLILPFALFYFYIVFAHASGFRVPGGPAFFDYTIVGWAGVFSCFAGLILLYWSLVSFGSSFRVGIDQNNPDNRNRFQRQVHKRRQCNHRPAERPQHVAGNEHGKYAGQDRGQHDDE